MLNTLQTVYRTGVLDALSVTPFPQGNQKDGEGVGVGPRPSRSWPDEVGE
jgi:hypothetical protein